jgi:hypothetical protein
MDNLGPYIRPCAAFPDGLLFDRKYVDVLTNRGLIEQDTWSDNHHPTDDYAAIYGDEDVDSVIDTILWITRPR